MAAANVASEPIPDVLADVRKGGDRTLSDWRCYGIVFIEDAHESVCLHIRMSAEARWFVSWRWRLSGRGEHEAAEGPFNAWLQLKYAPIHGVAAARQGKCRTTRRGSTPTSASSCGRCALGS